MSAAGEAFQAARKLITEAKRGSLDSLSFSGGSFRFLDLLPQEIVGLTKLKHLYLDNLPVDISPLKEMRQLTHLHIRNARLWRSNALSDLTWLTHLDLSGSDIDDLSAISRLTRLQYLSLAGTKVAELHPLSMMHELNDLNLADTRVFDISPLLFLKRLTKLNLRNTLIDRVDPLSELRALQELDISKTPVADIRPLAQLTNIAKLDLRDTAAANLLPILKLRRLAVSPNGTGLTFDNCLAARIDPKIGEISELRDERDRAKRLVEYLKDTNQPIGQADESEPRENLLLPNLPLKHSAPIETTITAGKLVLINSHTKLHSTGAISRAEQGWKVLKEFRESFGESFHIANYAPLPSVLRAFDRALGDHYDASRQIALGIHGQRIVALSFDSAFVETLPTGAETELKGFAAAISTFINRFPDWLEYQAEAAMAEPAAALVVEERTTFIEIDQILADAPEASDEIKIEYHEEVAAATGPGMSEVSAKGLVASTRDVVRTLSENALTEARNGVKAKAFAARMQKTGETELPKATYWLGGWTIDILSRMSPSLRRLAKKFPKSMGWMVAILDYLGLPKN
ncbi:hypothetical protein QKW60_14215 [Defluviimonas aestuarii]|uniref:leucine-rich repeat domain-containing protein n=1 Tax=Albidovulum aestuarii TaxID=1130726 RepID=UPI00249C867E|nr:hypothetical protein [Defluviimonas aestuarii]MDI3337568.1 hypothetical protein [Defluviimonas aestuarii]